MTSSFTFDGYTVRPLSEQDRRYLEIQIAADEYHRDTMTADFFLHLQPGEDAWALEDEQGRVIFYFKTVTACRIAIQFTAEANLEGKRRNAAALLRGLAWIEGILRGNKFRELIFDTEGPELRNFALRHLGFTEAFGLLSRPLTTLTTPETPPRAVGTVPTSTSQNGRTG